MTQNTANPYVPFYLRSCVGVLHVIFGPLRFIQFGQILLFCAIPTFLYAEISFVTFQEEEINYQFAKNTALCSLIGSLAL